MSAQSHRINVVEYDDMFMQPLTVQSMYGPLQLFTCMWCGATVIEPSIIAAGDLSARGQHRHWHVRFAAAGLVLDETPEDAGPVSTPKEQHNG